MLSILLSLTPHYGEDYSILMALFDLVPVAFFFASGVFMLKDLYYKQSKTGYAMMSSGFIFVLVAGFLKAVWKIICSLQICDFAVFNLMFMPIQSIGFALISIALMLVVIREKKDTKTMAFAPLLPIYFLLLSTNRVPLEMVNKSTPFLIIQTIGGSAMLILLIIMAKRAQNKLALWLLILSFVTMWGMGGLAATQDKMSIVLWNWLEELDNTISQGTLFFAVLSLHKKGFFIEEDKKLIQ